MTPSNPTKAQMSLSASLSFLVLALLGLFASLQLLLSELKVLSDPAASLICDVNPLIACSNSLSSPQAHLLGMPNSILGIILFTSLTTLAVLLASGARFARWIWWGLCVGTLVGMVYVIFFLYSSIVVFKALCPYCMLIWVAIIGIWTLSWSSVAAEGLFGKRRVSLGIALKKNWVFLALAICLVIVLILVVVFRNSLGYFF